jgi:hypothetical protein
MKKDNYLYCQTYSHNKPTLNKDKYILISPYWNLKKRKNKNQKRNFNIYLKIFDCPHKFENEMNVFNDFE